MYSSGQGVPQNFVEAHKWWNLAASRASAENQTQMAEGRDALAALMTPAQIVDAQQRASAWLTAFEQRGGK
jgi:TPR repeat protein